MINTYYKDFLIILVQNKIFFIIVTVKLILNHDNQVVKILYFFGFEKWENHD